MTGGKTWIDKNCIEIGKLSEGEYGIKMDMILRNLTAGDLEVIQCKEGLSLSHFVNSGPSCL